MVKLNNDTLKVYYYTSTKLYNKPTAGNARAPYSRLWWRHLPESEGDEADKNYKQRIAHAKDGHKPTYTVIRQMPANKMTRFSLLDTTDNDNWQKILYQVKRGIVIPENSNWAISFTEPHDDSDLKQYDEKTTERRSIHLCTEHEKAMSAN